MSETCLCSQHDLLHYKSSFRGSIGSVVDGGERNLSTCSGVHGVKVVDESFHCLISLASDLFVSKLSGPALHLLEFCIFYIGKDLLEFNSFDLHVVVVPCHAGTYVIFRFYIEADGLSLILPVFNIHEEINHLAQVLVIKLLIGLSHAGGNAIIEVRNRLTAVLVILIGLNGNAS